MTKDYHERKNAGTPSAASLRRRFFGGTIKIRASAKNAKQNNSSDDDDLRVALDGFDFGKYEKHDEKTSWKGFGTSASWNGVSLKGGTKTVYFFGELQKGKHTLQFFADETPILKSIEVETIESNGFELKGLKPEENIEMDKNGIPWLSFIFLGTPTKTLTLGVRTKARTKDSTDGSNLKVVVNGKVQQSPNAPTSRKYKNFYFSGDLREFDVLSIAHEDFSKSLAFENAVELWYDQQPEITNLKINFFDEEAFLEYLKSLDLGALRKQVLGWANLAIFIFLASARKYSAEFLQHALKDNPDPFIFQNSDRLVALIKKDSAYLKIIDKITDVIYDH
jgi:hypothetical protein